MNWCGVWVSLVGAGLLAARAEVELGSEVLASGGFQELRGKRVGLITNPSGANRQGRSTVDVLRAAPGVDLVALFGPEHGVYGTVKAGDKVESSVDSRTGLPVHSLYGATRKPTAEMLQGLEVLVYDLQDTGVRSYTYISTMGLAMEACAEAGVEFVVLDRPNPLGGLRVEGPMLERAFRSFIGQWNVPYVYGMTCGELARMINGERWIAKACRLRVIPMAGWERRMTWRDTGLKWVSTSPNVRSVDAVFGYAAVGLLGEMGGGSGLTLGGALERPFQLLSAPWLDPTAFARQLERRRLRGVKFPPFRERRNGKVYYGVELEFTDPARAPLVAISFHALDAIRQVSGRNLVREAEEAGRDLGLLDKAAGSDRWRKAVLAGRSATDIVADWREGEEAFRKLREPYLLYADRAAASVKRAGRPSRLPAGATEFRVVTVARGDTAFKLAREFGVTVSVIAEANPGVNVVHLKVGQKLRIPRYAPGH